MFTELMDSPHLKSIDFLNGVCSIDGIELIPSRSVYDITLRVHGRSGRHYEIVASNPIGLYNEGAWETRVIGAAWKKDLTSKQSRPYTAKLCLEIHEDKQHLPIGDRLASLALSLHNDIRLAMDIPLVAQFIVCPRNDLHEIHTFQEELIVTEEMYEQQFSSNDLIESVGDEDEEFEFIDFLPNFWHLENDDEPLNLEPTQNTWVQDIEEDIMRHYERLSD
jgi:hypothetical protein